MQSEPWLQSAWSPLLSVRRPGRCSKASSGRASTSRTRRPGRRGCAARSTRATTSRSWWTGASWTSQTPTKFTASSRRVPRKVSARFWVTLQPWGLGSVVYGRGDRNFLNCNSAFIKGQRSFTNKPVVKVTLPGVKMCVNLLLQQRLCHFSVCRIPTGGQSPESSKLSDAPVLSFPANPGDFQVREKIHSLQRRY